VTYLNVEAVYKIARHEFVSVILHPLIPVACLIVLAIAILNGAGGAANLQQLQAMSDGSSDVFFSGFRQSWGAISMICTIMAIFMGATMIPYERWKNSLNVLLIKPLYRKDYLLGKFAGLTAFMLLFNAFAIMLVGLSVIVFFRGPQSDFEFIWRITAYIIALTLGCSLAIALNMLIGLLARNILFVTAASIAYVFFEWIWYDDRILGTGLLSLITPMNLYGKFINPPGSMVALFNTAIPFGQWFGAIIPFLALLIIELLMLLTIEIFLFAKEDTI
jgi:ABC-2 type transport system permease protein